MRPAQELSRPKPIPLPASPSEQPQRVSQPPEQDRQMRPSPVYLANDVPSHLMETGQMEARYSDWGQDSAQFHSSSYSQAMGVGMRTQAVRGVLPRGQLHKKNPKMPPKPCVGGHLPPWISLKGNKPKQGRSRSAPLEPVKHFRQPSHAEAEATLRRLRGAYLPLHDEEQKRIPYMSSKVDVNAENRYYEQVAAERLQGIHDANIDLKQKLQKLSTSKRNWERRAKRRMPPPPNAIADFDKNERPPPGNREMFRANVKLRAPPQSCFDTVNGTSLYVRDPLGSPKKEEEEVEEQPEEELEEKPVVDPLANVKVKDPSELRVQLFEMERSINDILHEAKAMEFSKWEPSGNNHGENIAKDSGAT